MKKAMCLAVVALAANVMLAQAAKSGSTSNPVSDDVRQMIGDKAKNMIAAAEEMPAEKYSYKPTPEQMSFGHLVEHTAEGNTFFCSKLTSQAASPSTATEKDSKEKLVAQLKSSFDYCETALKGLQDSQLSEPVTLFGGRQGNKAAAVLGVVSGWADHYSIFAIYLRLNGLLPPTAKKASGGAKD